MPKLNDTQLVILTAAAQRDDRLVLPLPGSLKLDAAAESRTLKGLIKRTLIATRPAARGEPAWQAGDGEPRQTLIVTEAGLAAIGVTDDADSATIPKALPKRSTTRRTNKRAGKAEASKAPSRKGQKPAKTGDDSPKRVGKVAQIRELLERPNGAGIDELTAATGWQPHSVRAALTGLRKRGIDVQREKQDGETRYRVVAA